MWSASFFLEIKMYSQRKKCIVKEIQWELTEKILFQEIFASYESFIKRDHCHLLGRFLTALKASKTQKNSITALQLLKFLILKKGLLRLTTYVLRLLKLLMLKKDSITVLKFLIPKKDSITFLRLLKFLILKKDTITSLRLLKVLILKSDSIKLLWLY